MFVNSRKIINIIEEFAPQKLAEQWDNVGFQIGNKNIEVDKVMVALEVDDDVLQEAIAENVDLIITHHPLIFSKINRLTTDDPIQQLVIKMIKNNINLYVARTNIDASKEGTNNYLAKLLNLERTQLLDETHRKQYYKLVTYCPPEHSQRILDELFKHEVGKIGNYENASYKSFGQGTFKPLEGSNPYKGEKNQLEVVKEERIEVLVHEDNLSKAVNAIINYHPYEEPAYDIVPIKNEFETYGIGLIGYLEKTTSFETFIGTVKDILNIKNLKVVGELNKKIKKVALCTGAGSDYINLAKNHGCDCLITGDIKYHEAKNAQAINLNVIDAGHFETENIYTNYLYEKLKDVTQAKGYDVKIIQSKAIKNPFQYINQ
jgi:dinuclear metal center YbgI/SA1388 family protein